MVADFYYFILILVEAYRFRENKKIIVMALAQFDGERVTFGVLIRTNVCFWRLPTSSYDLGIFC
ncbi:hypothetical protein RED65_04220 [Oceanobacter sp. RED65]|uniref:Uncharacterized protein n=1 Tax=Bermanella marisrubri TaxID=207949 RepID=Q1N1T1_9GAMM|nr:hypothetical protein RED65_04220 [Oceanobacter sp. RED65] [Bermanella marisrubri]